MLRNDSVSPKSVSPKSVSPETRPDVWFHAGDSHHLKLTRNRVTAPLAAVVKATLAHARQSRASCGLCRHDHCRSCGRVPYHRGDTCQTLALSCHYW